MAPVSIVYDRSDYINGEQVNMVHERVLIPSIEVRQFPLEGGGLSCTRGDCTVPIQQVQVPDTR